MRSSDRLKQQLAAELVRGIHGWTPGQLLHRMRIDQPRVSDLRRGRLERISIARLLDWLDAMGLEVHVSVGRKPPCRFNTKLAADRERASGERLPPGA